MSCTDKNRGTNIDSGEDEYCRLCGLQSFKEIFEESASSLNEIKKYPCFMKAVISFLHEKILGFRENDESSKPTVSLSFGNEYLESPKIQDLRKQHSDLIKKYPASTSYSKKCLDEFQPVNTISFEYIKAKEELIGMLNGLLKFSEVAVNLEHWSKNYLGFTWLLQISTTKTNYFIDCLTLETEIPILNEVFMNNNILKIFYKGKDNVLRLQKDFGIFVTNIFDICIIQDYLQISQETQLMENPAFSFLDSKHTYLLLHIKNYLTDILFELGKTKSLKSVRRNGKKICSQIYKKPEWNDVNVLQNLGPTKATGPEIHVIKQLLIWRDKTAKTEDVSLNFVLADDKILKCAQELLLTENSATLNKYCKAEFLENAKVNLNIDKIIKTTNKIPGKKLCITNSLSNITGVSAFKAIALAEFAQERSLRSDVQPSAENSTHTKSETINDSIDDRNVVVIESSSIDDKFLKQKKTETINGSINDENVVVVNKIHHSSSINDNFLKEKKSETINDDSINDRNVVATYSSSINDKFLKQKKSETMNDSIDDKNVVIDSSSSKDHFLIQKRSHVNKSVSSKIYIRKPDQSQLLKILKPQLNFKDVKDVIDNNSRIWKPRITEKPNRSEPLHLEVVKRGSNSRYCHPYKLELQNFCIPRNQLIEKTPIPFGKVEETPLHVIKSLTDLISSSKALKNYSEIAVDLQYNKKRSYAGYTSLLMISTRDSDYIYDALSLRSELHILNEVFTDPRILKVFHNGVNKLMWLQKDLSLYVVNMFDTARIDMMFSKKILGLAHLQEVICDIKFKELLKIKLPEEDEDWRIRPLSFKVKNYLRYDTHYLLYIKDELSNNLCETGNWLRRYYDYCTNLCKNVYQKPCFKINSYKNILNKKSVKNKYFGHFARIKVIKELNRLRHMIAQAEDENPNDILSEEILLKLVDSLSHDQQNILSIWTYEKKKIYVSQIIKIIYSAKNIKTKTKYNDDYRYLHESEKYLDEIVKSEINDEYNSRCKVSLFTRPIITLGDCICSDKTIRNDLAYRKDNYNHDLNTSFILIKGNRWDETRNIGDWLNKWLGKTWPGNYYLKKLNEATILINLFGKKYKELIWKKRNQIHYEEGAFLQNLLDKNNIVTQKSITNIAKDLRSNGLQVKIRELALKIEDKWYEWKPKTASLQEISEEEVRKRGIDTDV